MVKATGSPVDCGFDSHTTPLFKHSKLTYMTQGRLFELFTRLRENKSEAKEIKTIYKDALNSSPEYVKLTDEIKLLKEDKKLIEAKVKSEMSSELDKLESIKNEILNDKQVLADTCLSKLTKNEDVSIIDEYETKYEAVFSVKYKKMD